jgi:hypothetical protein
MRRSPAVLLSGCESGVASASAAGAAPVESSASIALRPFSVRNRTVDEVESRMPGADLPARRSPWTQSPGARACIPYTDPLICQSALRVVLTSLDEPLALQLHGEWQKAFAGSMSCAF